MEHRKSPRRQVILNVELTYPDGATQVVSTRDLSDGGMFLILDKLHRPILGELVGVQLVGESAEKETLPGSEAVVVHQESEGIGLAFIQMDFEDDF